MLGEIQCFTNVLVFTDGKLRHRVSRRFDHPILFSLEVTLGINASSTIQGTVSFQIERHFLSYANATT